MKTDITWKHFIVTENKGTFLENNFINCLGIIYTYRQIICSYKLKVLHCTSGNYSAREDGPLLWHVT